MGKDLTLEKRALSCFCECCVEGAEEVEGCFNKLHVGSWEKGTPTRKRKEKSQCRKMRLSKKLSKRKNTQVDIVFK